MVTKQESINSHFVLTELRMDIKNALETLPEDQRRVLEVKYLSGNGDIMTDEGVGKELGIDVKDVQAKQGQAFATLKASKKSLFKGYR